MFELTKEEAEFSRSQSVTLKTGQGHNIKYLPFAFTEYGVVMLSSVLKSKTAIEININIIRAFVHMRQYLLSNIPKQELDELRKRVEYLEEDISSIGKAMKNSSKSCSQPLPKSVPSFNLKRLL